MTMWKKGDKVVRIYGSNKWRDLGGMHPGDIGTVAKDQEYPGVVQIKEFSDSFGHDPIRLRRVKDYPGFDPKSLSKLWHMVDNKDFEGIAKMMLRIKRKRKPGPISF